MFDPGASSPRVFATPLGVDFPRALVEGLRSRATSTAPDALARVHVIVNTARMRRRIRQLFAEGPATLLPRITLVSDIGMEPAFHDLPPASTPLARRMELVPLVHKLVQTDPRLAVQRSLFDLSDSLAALMDEMQGEGVPLSAINDLRVEDQSGHWGNAKQFLSITGQFLGDTTASLDPEGRRRRAILRMIEEWQTTPPDHPIIVAGSTGSRGTTGLLMRAAAMLPQGAVILPGLDREMPDHVWAGLMDGTAGALSPEDHPQYRFAALMRDLDITAQDVPDWHEACAICDPARRKVLSLALRPAPVTDSWLREGPDLDDLPSAMANVTLALAATPREEALTIAMRLRQAAEDGQTAALITPDRMLTRQVTAALDRWDLKPDDSAGTPLQLSPPGRFLRHVGDLLACDLTAESLLTLLKHPLTHTGADRNTHLLHTRALELHLRAKGPAFPGAAHLRAWAVDKNEDAQNWAEWVVACFCDQTQPGTHDAAALSAAHITLAEQIAAGPSGEMGALWDKGAGRTAQSTVLHLQDCLDGLPPLLARDYLDLFNGVLAQGEVRDPDAGHPNVLIWGTLEARVQGADLLILAGLNEGSWPEVPPPDPWLNRQMRADAGLLLPERRIGLSAHDFEQAASAPEVWLTRSTRSDDAQTVPSRWLNRLTNLLSGLPGKNGPQAMDEMTARGDHWIALGQTLETPITAPPAPRPSPRPAVDARPRSLSLTSIKTLVRDPYAIYARHVLNLNPLESLAKSADARLRGIAVHTVFEQFLKTDPTDLDKARLLTVARDVFAADVDWPSARLLWEARIDRIADEFLTGEAQRQMHAHPTHFEARGNTDIPELGFTIRAQADRIDMDAQGSAWLYDYKTGQVPSIDQQFKFDMQLLLLAAMTLKGAFKDVTPRHIAHAEYLGFGATIKNVLAPLDEKPPLAAWADLTTLLGKYLDPDQGFTARRAMEKSADTGTYDHLSRFGEWDETQSSDTGGVIP